jgi:hypothetical protein
MVLLATTSGHAQAPAPQAQAPQAQAPQAQAPQASLPPQAQQPVTGFVSPYEISRTARLAGFDPQAPPLREGTIYVLRATDYRGILMRVVVDARTGAIRDVNRIVPGPGSSGQLGLGPYGSPPPYSYGPYGPPPYGYPLFGELPADGVPDYGPPQPGSADAELPLRRPAIHSPHPAGSTTPLPRPRPAAVAARKPATNSGKPAVDPTPNTMIAAPPSTPAAPAAATPAEPLKD